jgi:hypothetical protein
MSNLKNHFTSKLISVTATQAKDGRHVYTAAFEDGTETVIRTSNRAYASVTQIRLDHWHERDAQGEYHPVDRTDFLFSSKAVPALNKYQQKRLVATVTVNPGASAPAGGA